MMKRWIIAMGIISGILGLLGCASPNSSNQGGGDSFGLVADRINIDGVANELQKLRDGKTEFEFIGIVSNSVDCIYFVKDNEIFQIEYEAIVEEQIPYIEELKKFANSNGYKNLMMTYGNKPKYSGPREAPVIRIETNTNLTDTARVGSEIQRSVFKNNDQTIYDVVP